MPAAFYEFTGEQGADFVTSLKVMRPGGGLFKFIPPAARAVTTEVTNGEYGCDAALPVPGLTQRFWEKGISSADTLSIDVPEEIKLAYPNLTDAFGWLKASTANDVTNTVNKNFLTIRCQIRNSKNCLILSGFTTYKTVAIPCPTDTSNYKIGTNISSSNSVIREGLNNNQNTSSGAQCNNIAFGSGLVLFDLVNNSTEYNVIMKIPSCNSSTGCLPRSSTGSTPKGTLDFQGKFLYDIELEYYVGSTPSTTKPFVIRLLQGRFTFNPNITQ